MHRLEQPMNGKLTDVCSMLTVHVTLEHSELISMNWKGQTKHQKHAVS